MFDIIGDIHSCQDELAKLLIKLGHRRDDRKIVFCGDYGDRGEDPVGTYNLVMSLCESGQAIGVIGNHDDKLRRYLLGNKVTISHGLQGTIDAFLKETPEWRNKVLAFLTGLPYELILDDGKLSVSHAGLPEKLQGVINSKSKSHAMYGDTDGTKDADGYPTRKDFAKDYGGHRVVVHGHTVTEEVDSHNNVWSIDTGAVFGGKLTALRYPEMETTARSMIRPIPLSWTTTGRPQVHRTSVVTTRLLGTSCLTGCGPRCYDSRGVM